MLIDEGKKGVKVELPLVDAFWISLEQIRRRLKRSSITVASVSLGLAFLVYFLTSNLIIEVYGEQLGLQVEAYQYWLVIISLIVCIVGLTNSNLISVYERYREIGTMKALGALDQHILKLFFLESLIYGLIGGTIGFVGGIIGAAASIPSQIGLAGLLNLPAQSILTYIGYSIGIAVVLSVGATVFPAFKASKLHPVEALEYEL